MNLNKHPRNVQARPWWKWWRDLRVMYRRAQRYRWLARALAHGNTPRLSRVSFKKLLKYQNVS